MKSLQAMAESLGITVAILRSWQINLNLEHPRYEAELPVYPPEWERYFEQVSQLRRQGLSFRKIRQQLQGQQPAHAPAEPHAVDLPASPAMTEPHRDGQREPHRETHAVMPVTASSQALVDQNPRNGTPSVQALQKHMHEALVQQDLTKMAQTYVHLMENYQNLAGRFSENTYLLGQLEEKAEALELRLEEKDAHNKEKEARYEAHTRQLEAHIDTLQKALDSSDERFDQAQGHLQKKEADLDAHQQTLVTKEEIQSMEARLEGLQAVLSQQNDLLQAESKKGFWQRLFGKKD